MAASNAIFFAPLRVPVIDPVTKLMTREWYLFLQAMWLRIGGSTAPTIDDLLQSLPAGLETADVQAIAAAIEQAASQQPGYSQGLASLVPEFMKDLQGLSQNPSL